MNAALWVALIGAANLPSPLPMYFEPADAAGHAFHARAGRGDVWATQHGWTFSSATRRHRFKIALAGARTVFPQGRDRLPGKVSEYHGRDPRRWRQGISIYGAITYPDVYPGVDLVLHPDSSNRELEYDFLVAPGGAADRIALTFSGVREMHLNAEGALVLEVPGMSVVQRPPLAYQWVKGKRRTVSSRYVLEGSNVTLLLGKYDRTKPLVVDPVLMVSTYLGGSLNNIAYAVASDSAGNAYMTGSTDSTDFPVHGAIQDTYGGGPSDVFVAKIDPAGCSLLYATYLGGTDSDVGYDIAVDASGNAFVTGSSHSTDFPTQTPFQANSGGADDVIIAKLGPTGTLLYSTYLGGMFSEQGHSIALDGSGNIYVVGGTGSPDFPVLNALQGSMGGNPVDAFVTKMNASGSALLYSTYLGASSADSANGVAVNASGQAYVTGYTSATNFPTQNPLQPNSGGGGADAFVTRYAANGSSLIFSTYLGGSETDVGHGIALDGSGNVYVAGSTESIDFPTQSPLQANAGGFGDAFVAKLTAAGNALSYSTYLGGGENDVANAIAVTSTGSAWVAGFAGPGGFPVLDSAQANFGGGIQDAFVTHLTASGALTSSSTFGGSSNEIGNGVALMPTGDVWVAGHTFSTDFPTVNALQSERAGVVDSFLARVGSGTAATCTGTPDGGSDAGTSSDGGTSGDAGASGDAGTSGDGGSEATPVAGGPVVVRSSCGCGLAGGDSFLTLLGTAFFLMGARHRRG